VSQHFATFLVEIPRFVNGPVEVQGFRALAALLSAAGSARQRGFCDCRGDRRRSRLLRQWDERTGPASSDWWPGKVFDAPQLVGRPALPRYCGDCHRDCPPQRLAARVDPPFTECFMTAPSPGIIATTMLNADYPSHEAYLDAIAREMAYEYRAMVDAGFVLQIDAPDLAMRTDIVWQIERTLAEAAIRPVLFYPVGAANLGSRD
jgi:hypothetical protein